MLSKKIKNSVFAFKIVFCIMMLCLCSCALAEDVTMGLSPEKIAEIEQKVKPVLNGSPVTDIPQDDRLLLFLAEGLFPESFDLFFRHGEYLTKEKADYTQAIPRLKTALELEPKDLSTLELLAICHSALKEEADELSCWETLRELLDNDDSSEAKQLRERVMVGLDNMARKNEMVMRPGKRFIVYTPISGNYTYVAKELTDERLEEVYTQVTKDLKCIPAFRTSIIALEPSKFKEVKPTAWAGGFAKGGKSMVVPAERFVRSEPDTILPAKSLVLHEFTHNIIFVAGNGKCPTWLNEGLAEFAEHKNDSFTEFKPIIRPTGQILTVVELEKEFHDIRSLSSKDTERVIHAYRLAGLYARFLIQNFTMSVPRQIINGLKDGSNFEIVLGKVSNLTLDTFDQKFRKWVNELSY